MRYNTITANATTNFKKERGNLKWKKNIYSSTQATDSELRTRGIIAAVFTAISAAATVALTIWALANGEAKSFPDALLGSALLGFVFGGWIPGLTHIKSIFGKIKKLLYIFPVGWAIFLVLFLGIPYLGGWVFMLTDLVKFIKMRKENN